jgi:hypothetical protein
MGFFDRKKADTDHGSTDDHKFDVPGLAEFASTAGWKPLGAQPLKSPFDDFVNWASKDTVGEMAEGGLNSTVRAVTSFYGAFGGDIGGRSFAVSNAYTTGFKGSWVSVARLWFPTMPEIHVYPRIGPRKVRFLARGAHETGDFEFDRRFTVETSDPTLADQVLAPAVRAVLQRRDDWYFKMFGYEVVCVCPKRYESVAEVRDRLSVLESLLTSLPAGIVQELPSTLSTLPDGTAIDVTHPEELVAAIKRLTAEQQAQAFQQFKQLDPEQGRQLMMQFLQHKDHGGH